jgi:hypothetical protein
MNDKEMEALKEKVFKVIDRQIEIKDFESWLYDQSSLSERMDEALILELYSFNYNQRAASFEFKQLFLPFFDEKEFIEWKIIANLKTLSAGCNEPERILGDFYKMGCESYPCLAAIGYNNYWIEDCEQFGWSRQKMIREIQNEAKLLLFEIEEWLETSSYNDLMQFQPKSKKLEMENNTTSDAPISTEVDSKKWWEFWK